MLDIKFKAAILEKSNSDLVVDEIIFKGNLKAGQVLVKIFYSGICGAQINEIQASKGPDKFLPHLLGHEGYGEVVEIGELVSTVAVGDKVILHWMPGSGVQSEPAKYEWRNETLNAGWVTTLSEFSIISENRCTRIKTELDPRYLPLLGCAATTAAGVIANDCQLKMGDSIIVIGTGGVGLLTIEAARASGAFPIIGIDIFDQKLEEATKFGAHKVFNSTEPNLINKILENLPQKFPNFVVETTGVKSMIELSYKLISNKGKSILVGVPKHDEPILIDTLPLHFDTQIIGSKGGKSKPEIDIQKYANLAQEGYFRFDTLPITIFYLNEINKGINELKNGLVGRVVIDLSK